MLTIEQIQAVVADYFKDKPVKKVWLFGSYARGEADEASDVDLLVDLDKSQKVGLRFFEWPIELTEGLRKEVDLVSNAERPEHSSNWALLQHLNQHKQLLYEKR